MASILAEEAIVEREATAPREKPLGTRERIPALGLKEYWYPALPAKEVGRRKPVERKLLGERLVFFRDTNDEVVAMHHTCSHRGASLAYGDIHFKGTLTCPYHGWTFDGKGELLAVLGEGPNSTLPGAKGTKMRTYPTVTIRGVVFVWMGDGPAVDPKEDLPVELFDPNLIVMSGQKKWNANWRAGVENFTDAHVYYVHRNSLEFITMPIGPLMSILHQGPNRPEMHVVNDRFLCFKPGKESLLDQFKYAGKKATRPFQDDFPGLGKWPATKLRLYFSNFFSFVRSIVKPSGPLTEHPEWGSGCHLPATIHIDYYRWIFTRYEVPVDANTTNNYFFCTWRGHNAWQRFFWPIYFKLYFKWKMIDNFSTQDAVMAEITDYTAPERMSPTDIFPREWRRFVLEYGRDFKRQDKPGA